MNVKDIENLKSVNAFVGNFAIFTTRENKVGIINRMGEVVYAANKYDGAFIVKDNVFELQIFDGKTPSIYFDAEKRAEVAKPNFSTTDGPALPEFAKEYANAFWCATNRIAFQDGDLLGIMDADGKVIAPAQYTYISWAKMFGFKNTLICVKDEKGLQGYIDLDGKTVIPCQYPFVCKSRTLDIFKFHTTENKWGYMDATGKIIIPAIYDSIDAGSTYGLNEIAVSKDGRCYFINAKQEEVKVF